MFQLYKLHLGTEYESLENDIVRRTVKSFCEGYLQDDKYLSKFRLKCFSIENSLYCSCEEEESFGVTNSSSINICVTLVLPLPVLFI